MKIVKFIIDALSYAALYAALFMGVVFIIAMLGSTSFPTVLLALVILALGVFEAYRNAKDSPDA